MNPFEFQYITPAVRRASSPRNYSDPLQYAPGMRQDAQLPLASAAGQVFPVPLEGGGLQAVEQAPIPPVSPVPQANVPAGVPYNTQGRNLIGGTPARGRLNGPHSAASLDAVRRARLAPPGLTDVAPVPQANVPAGASYGTQGRNLIGGTPARGRSNTLASADPIGAMQSADQSLLAQLEANYDPSVLGSTAQLAQESSGFGTASNAPGMTDVPVSEISGDIVAQAFDTAAKESVARRARGTFNPGDVNARLAQAAANDPIAAGNLLGQARFENRGATRTQNYANLVQEQRQRDMLREMERGPFGLIDKTQTYDPTKVRGAAVKASYDPFSAEMVQNQMRQIARRPGMTNRQIAEAQAQIDYRNEAPARAAQAQMAHQMRLKEIQAGQPPAPQPFEPRTQVVGDRVFFEASEGQFQEVGRDAPAFDPLQRIFEHGGNSYFVNEKGAAQLLDGGNQASPKTGLSDKGYTIDGNVVQSVDQMSEPQKRVYRRDQQLAVMPAARRSQHQSRLDQLRIDKDNGTGPKNIDSQIQLLEFILGERDDITEKQMIEFVIGDRDDKTDSAVASGSAGATMPALADPQNLFDEN